VLGPHHAADGVIRGGPGGPNGRVLLLRRISLSPGEHGHDGAEQSEKQQCNHGAQTQSG